MNPLPTLTLAGTVPQSITDGPGLRLTIFTQGCPHHCPGCHNSHTWPLEGGTTHTTQSLLTLLDRNPLLRGVTFSGGEPLLQAEALLPFAQGIKARGKDIVCYTGYTFEQLVAQQEENASLKQLLSLVDYLIDGPFILAQRDLTLAFRGSTNQRILQLAPSLSSGHPVEISW